MGMKKLFIVIGMLASAPVLAAPKPAETPVATRHSNVVYASYSGLSLLMDVKVPAKPNGYGVVHIPGSGFQAPMSMEPWQLKDEQYQLPVEQAMLDAGFTVFTINHRAAPRFKYPAALEDAQRAVRFVRAHAKEYNISPDWLGLLGVSSGATLVGTLATRGEGTDEGLAQAAKDPKKAQCAVAVMGGYDLLSLGQDGLAVALLTNYIDVPAPFPDEAGFPGYPHRLAPYVAASPMTYVDATMPHMLLLHGDKDKLIPISQSEIFEKKVKEVGGSITLKVMTDIGHAFPPLYRQEAASWMTRCLSETKPAS
jgi:acetyl esterase/lipase